LERKDIEEKAPKRKKTLALKSTPTISDEDEEEENDEDLSLIVKNVKRMYNKAKFENRRRWQGKKKRKIICYNYRKPGQVIAECPEIRSKLTTSKKPYKKKP